MPSKNISVREADELLWQRAEERAKASSMSLSSYVAFALSTLMGGDPYEQITVKVNTGTEGFRGRWLVGPNFGVKGGSPAVMGPAGRGQGPFIAETARGRIAVWITDDADPDGSGARLAHYDSIGDAEAAWEDTFPQELWDTARNALSESNVIWRDI